MNTESSARRWRMTMFVTQIKFAERLQSSVVDGNHFNHTVVLCRLCLAHKCFSYAFLSEPL